MSDFLRTYRELAERRYYFELERRDRISTGFTGPVSAASLLSGAVFLLFSSMPVVTRGPAYDLVQCVYLGLALAMTCIVASIVWLGWAWSERDGTKVPDGERTREYMQLFPESLRQLAERASESSQDVPQSTADAYARKLLEAELTTLYIEYSTNNMQANEWRAYDRARIIALLVVAFVVLLGTMVPYAALSLSHPPVLRIQTI